MFEHLSLRRWPFVTVPELSVCDFIAGRGEFRDNLEQLLRNLSRQNTSSIYPIWSWYGAGKTHALYFLANRAKQIHEQGTCHFRTIYSEFPRMPTSFVDVYKSFALQLDRETLIEAYSEICTSNESERLERDLIVASSDLVCALKALIYGNPIDQDLAIRWIRADTLPPADCRKLGISRKIGSSEESSRVLTGLIRMFGLSASSESSINHRLVWLLDELQRIDQLPIRVQDEVNTGLHSVFNSCPTGFTMILSFSGLPDDALPEWFSPELRDRVGRTKAITLPIMERDDALEFIREVLARSRPAGGDDIDPYFPFTEKSCRLIIDDIFERSELKPRTIMQTFNMVLQEADTKIERGEIETVSSNFAKTVLADLVELE